MPLAVAFAQLELALEPETLVALALLGWALAIFLAVVGIRRRAARPKTVPAPSADLNGAQEAPGPHRLLQDVTPAERGIGGVLRWLHHATEATGVAFLEMVPGWGERLHLEPRGLPAPVVASLTRLARAALLGGTGSGPEGTAAMRWMGVGASRGVVALDPLAEDAAEALRFARYLIEWIVASGVDDPLPDVERRARAVPGVAWAEVDRPAGTIRLVLAEGAGRVAVGAEVEREVQSEGVEVAWIDVAATPVPPRSTVVVPSTPTSSAEGSASPSDRTGVTRGDGGEPRVRLVEVALSEDGQVTADVQVMWKDHELRGRGHAHRSSSGRYLAGARAVADALRPLLDTDVVVRGLFRAATEPDVQVLIAEVQLEGTRLVGAVVDRDGQGHWTGARVVLDAVNRRLAQVAGRSGLI